jgi:hypothetical protein
MRLSQLTALILIGFSVTTFAAVNLNPMNAARMYDNQGSRYSIKYPPSWVYEIPDKGAVLFSDQKGPKNILSTVNIQTILTKKTGGDFDNVHDFIADMKKQVLKESPYATFVDHGDYAVHGINGTTLNGEYLVFIYSHNMQILQQWQIIVLRNDNQVFYTWAYTAPLTDYKQDLNVAKAMLDTWSIY